jgi:hypothetical protein
MQSQAIKANGLVFVSGQIPADTDGNLIEGSIGDKTALCVKNAAAVLDAAGSSIAKVVKVTVRNRPFPRHWVGLDEDLIWLNADFQGLPHRHGQFRGHE